MKRSFNSIAGNVDKFLFEEHEVLIEDETTGFIECNVKKKKQNNYQQILDDSDRMLLKDELYLKQVKLDDLARMTYTNRNYLSYAIKDIKGTTYRHYLNGFKLKHAMRLLQTDSEMSLHQAATLSGFTRTSVLLDELERSGDPALDWMKKKYLCKK